ncbi:O-antigen ligase family protein (plasmid) [Salipiger sp. H15]|uniref:O-antigen ligase family protein n=1 Tax=Alloyangia sp. H15 TaxID=3029062 RepID=A0AAU8AR11_9RHOB
MSVEVLKGAPRRHAEWKAAAGAVPRALPVSVSWFLVSLFVAFQLSLGPLKLSASRTLLLVLIVPLTLKLLRGAAGRLLVTDVAMISLCIWVFLSMFVRHGLREAIEFSGINAIETLGAYFLGRCMIRDPDSFAAMVRFMFGIVVFLTPFALLETLTGYNLLLHLTNAILPSQPEVPPLWRMGLERVQATLDHPIHFGICIGAFVALTFRVLGYGQPAALRYGRAGLVAFVAFLSLSSGALIAMMLQVLLFIWSAIANPIRDRWKLLALIVTCLVVFELSTGFFLNLVISKIAFNPDTAFNRTRIFGFALANIEGSPLFGIGLDEWVNLPGMSDSVDMFWMLLALRHGIPAGLMMLVGFLWLPLTLMTRDIPDPRVSAYREGYIVTLTALFLALWTVHVWREAYVLVIFLLGSGSWMLEYHSPPAEAPRRRPPVTFSRTSRPPKQ